LFNKQIYSRFMKDGCVLHILQEVVLTSNLKPSLGTSVYRTVLMQLGLYGTASYIVR
jgi:hypothetical protein